MELQPMTTRPPAEIGMPLDEVDTPALMIDLDAFERNLRRLADRVQGSGVRLRPHAKTHKCPVIALKQIELGAVGVCVQKVSEAEAMVYGGVRDVLVTNEIVGRQKLRHLMALAHTARIGVCADDPAQVADLEEAAREAGVTLPVHVEINMGGNRCGVEPGEPALALARLVADADYGRNLDPDGTATRAFEPSLFVWATVMSRPTAERAIVDAGLKALAMDSGPPNVWDEPAATYERASDEHGRLGISTATNRLRLGDKIRLVPGHCDPTVNLYDWYVAVRGDASKRCGRSLRGGRFIEECGCRPDQSRPSVAAR